MGTVPAGSAQPASPLGAHDPAPPTAYVYAGPGAGLRSVLSAVRSLREALVPDVAVRQLDAASLLQGHWTENALLLVMPGGADLPFCKHLNGKGNQLIRAWVEAGGCYLGLCAGAYYACARVEFEPGTKLEVVGDRELAFFPGTAAGSFVPGFCYQSEAGAMATPLRFASQQPRTGGEGTSSGGRAGPAAATDAWDACLDYANGGPAFLPPSGAVLPRASSSWQQQQQQQQQQPSSAVLEGVEVLAIYAALQRRCSSRPVAASSTTETAQAGNDEPAAAALLCRVGEKGCAVLCGTHPELHPSWLEGVPGSGGGASSNGTSSGGASGRGPGVDVVMRSTDNLRMLEEAATAPVAAAPAAAAGLAPGMAEHVQQLRQQLEASQPARWRFWRSLLVAGGLGPWLKSEAADEGESE